MGKLTMNNGVADQLRNSPFMRIMRRMRVPGVCLCCNNLRYPPLLDSDDSCDDKSCRAFCALGVFLPVRKGSCARFVGNWRDGA